MHDKWLVIIENAWDKPQVVWITYIYICVTGFTKTVPIGTRNEIQFIADY